MNVQEARGPEHVPGIFDVRCSVRENVLTPEIVQKHGLTAKKVVDAFRPERKGWVIEEDGRVVGVSIADSANNSIWALFVRPEYEGRGYGRALLDAAVNWLWQQGAERIWLSTGPETRAAAFYRRLGWQAKGTTPKGETRFELMRPFEG